MLTTVIDGELVDKIFAKVMMHNDLCVEIDELPEPLAQIIQSLPAEQQMLSLVTLLSQYRQMMFSPMPNQTLHTVPALPTLAKSILPSQWWQLAQKCLTAIAQDSTALVALVRLVASRGYGLHPTIWLPTKAFMEHDLADDELTKLYMPWYAWQHSGELLQDELTTDNWDEWYPAQRLAILKQWRADEPNKALEIIQACLPKENATERYKIVQVLAINLTTDDQGFLLSLQNDRSQKVSSFASQLLGRLGVQQDDEESLKTIRELNEGFEFTGNKIVARKTKNNKQRENRSKLLALVNIRQWAKFHTLTVSQFVLHWDFANNDYHDNNLFVSNIITILTDDEVQVLGDRLSVYLSKHTSEMELWHIIFTRLSQEAKLQFVDKLLQKDRPFALCLQVCPALLEIDFETLSKTVMYNRFIKKVKTQMSKEAGTFLDYATYDDCIAIGLLLSATTAKQVLEQLFELGVSRTDPTLYTLNLNAKLV